MAIDAGAGVDESVALQRAFCAIRVDPSFTDITCWASSDVGLKLLQHSLIGEILPRVVGQSRALVLHAGASVLDDRAVLFMAPSGAGKSTLVAAMARAGHVPIGDDCGYLEMAGTEARFGSFSNTCRLLHDSAAQFASRDALRNIPRDLAGKHEIRLERGDPIESARPISAIFEINPGGDTPIAVRRLKGHAALQALLASVLVLTPADPRVISRSMEGLAVLAELVPIFALDVPRNFAALPEVCRRIAEVARGCRATS